ncbi:MAG: ceramidase domain-containing protein [Myxococcota bacterium]
MPLLLAPPLADGCPWSGFLPPNIDWCEQELCAWVTNPANTWSNLAYFAFAIAMASITRRLGIQELRLFAPASFLVGAFSLVYHASYTFLFQFFDFVGMFAFCFVPITLNAIRLEQISGERQVWFYSVGVVAMSALVPLGYFAGFPIQALVLVLIIAIIGQEVAVHRRGGTSPDYRWYRVALALISAAAVFSALDVSRTFCDPNNHWIQGHAIWHVLSAAALFALFQFYRGVFCERSESALRTDGATGSSVRSRRP